METNYSVKLQKLMDKEDIRDVLLKYSRGVDRCDAELIAECYHDDAIDDHGSWSARATDVPGKIVDAIRQTTYAVTHFVGNTLIEVEGDTGWVESYFQAAHDFVRDGKRYIRIRAGRYIDRFERRAGHWKIAERVVADDWNKVDEVVERQAEVDEFRPGLKNKGDAVYAIRAGRVARDPF